MKNSLWKHWKCVEWSAMISIMYLPIRTIPKISMLFWHRQRYRMHHAMTILYGIAIVINAPYRIIVRRRQTWLVGLRFSNNIFRFATHRFSNNSTIEITLTGIPAISIPIHLSEKRLPLSLQLMGSNHSEKTLLTVAKWIEHHVNFPHFDFQESNQLQSMSWWSSN